MKPRTATLLPAMACAAILLGACENNDDPTSVNDGRLVVRLTDAPALIDSLKSVDLFVVRIDGRLTAASDADVNRNIDDPDRDGWITLATPNASFNLLALRDRVSSPLGDVRVRAAAYAGFRIIVDPSKSSVTLTNGRVLTASSSPGILFPSRSKIGVRIAPTKPVVVAGGETTTLIVDVDVGASFVQRGRSIGDGLLFQPLIRTTIIDAGINIARVRFINLTRSTINLRQDGNGVIRLNADQLSTCLTVNDAQPVAVNRFGSNALSVSFGPDLVPGLSYVVVAFETPSDAIRLITLTNNFAPAAGQAGLRVVNATGLTSGIDVFLTPGGSPTDAVKLASVLRDSTSLFVSVPAGVGTIRLTSSDGTSVLLDVQAQTFREGQRVTLVARPTFVGGEAFNAFIFEGC